MEICVECKKEKECNICLGKDKKGKKVYICDKCAYPKQTPFKIWSKELIDTEKIGKELHSNLKEIFKEYLTK